MKSGSSVVADRRLRMYSHFSTIQLSASTYQKMFLASRPAIRIEPVLIVPLYGIVERSDAPLRNNGQAYMSSDTMVCSRSWDSRQDHREDQEVDDHLVGIIILPHVADVPGPPWHRRSTPLRTRHQASFLSVQQFGIKGWLPLIDHFIVSR